MTTLRIKTFKSSQVASKNITDSRIKSAAARVIDLRKQIQQMRDI